jgi:hypothetical protein
MSLTRPRRRGMTYTREQLTGMTTNERLFETGLMNAFDQAISEDDYEKVRLILRSVFVDSESIDLIISRLNNK